MFRIISMCLVLFGALVPSILQAAESRKVVEVSAPVTPYIFNGDLRDLPQLRGWEPGDPVREIPIRRYPTPDAPVGVIEDLVLDPLAARQQLASERSSRGMADGFITPSRSFAGRGYTGVNPPDTVGDIGPLYYIQSVNDNIGAQIRIWDKSEPSPNEVVSFVLDSLGGGACGTGFGDPIVLWDREAQRWLLTEFASTGNNLCVYVSQTADPISGGWYAYAFSTPSFPDYPKYAVWATDANGGDGSYILTANDGGPGVYALDRGQMLNGQAATFQRIGMSRLSGFGVQGPAPADPDGAAPPPTGAPAMIMRHRDTEAHNGAPVNGDALELYYFSVDWQITSNTTLIQQPDIVVSEFSSFLCGLSTLNCFPQPNSSQTLMPLREVIHNRLQYMNHANDGYETLLGNLITDVDGTDRGGLRWFELRRTSPVDPWTLYQEGTYSPDSTNRFMGTSAMDQSGNIALGYNVVSATVFPSLRYTGRQVDDPLGVMTQPETTLHAGTSPNSSNRYGDYAAMSLDPTDDCTFWFTGMDNTSSNWRTHIGSFRFDRCGCLVAPLPIAVVAEVNDDNEIDLFWDDSELDAIIEYTIQRSRTPGGPYDDIAVISDSSPGFGNGSGYFLKDSDVSGGVVYYYNIAATDDGACRSDPAEVSVEATGICQLRPIFAGLSDANSAVTSTCGVSLDWSAATPECGGPATYSVYRATSPGLIPGPQNLLISGHNATSLNDISGLLENTDYSYVVRAVDRANGVEDDNLIEATVRAVGPGTGINVDLFETFEDSATFAAWTVTTGPGAHRCGEFERSNSTGERPSAGSGFYALSLSDNCIELLPQTSTSLDSPSVDYNFSGIQSVTLEFDLYYNHLDGDDATVEVWDGSQWVVIWADTNVDVDTRMVFDVTAQADGNANFRVRFNYQNANDDRWYSVDNVEFRSDVLNPCSTSSSPAPAADGIGGTTALRGDRETLLGDRIGVTWDASCGANEYNLIHGNLADLATMTLAGSVCDLSASGSYTWNAVPAGNLFFLVVGSDGAGAESPWGSATTGERNGITPSFTCGTTIKDLSGTCP